ncbi:hypothetical protein HBH56_101580 [Parastagonospora nodorum]|uniref:Uncharacterized protein n=2 Tax=Phaeosphaeria nodorum (strain SN15 / ATCC MYA-4574 / FGSC 10173) TaxID=321614 RepID=A0A7U2FFR3_PHANO|nr:hypothetical protein SNOG_10419 [Parastagonospora nodorum SN15]KAH3913321.1 hypothetical protein HBH56_101580 [Parastagonospora nodorum]EAT81813.1 hypothetical protein SNOG_10419 [Parastagonospora nodorum SN15]KAH3929371.1 hypothetical protein HBH54_128850 [Parastagonospora nodorum]KAH4137463.1 hypothetical protein HBH45_116980 [Parastagonospora nodorum]KAH4172198.1 hypothetical protein HBH44_032000 [Parastagonospora nodorum]
MNAAKEAKIASLHVKAVEFELEMAEAEIEHKMAIREIKREERRAVEQVAIERRMEEMVRRAEESIASERQRQAALEKEKAEILACLYQREQRDNAMIEDSGGSPRKKRNMEHEAAEVTETMDETDLEDGHN